VRRGPAALPDLPEEIALAMIDIAGAVPRVKG
jgi:hypothetical protein